MWPPGEYPAHPGKPTAAPAIQHSRNDGPHARRKAPATIQLLRGAFVKRHWNWRVWAGFGMALLAVYSYLWLFIRFPVTRDFPWVNLILFLVAGYLLTTGLYRAFTQPGVYRGRVSGPILGVLSLGIAGLFYLGAFYVARHLPSGETALKVGRQAPDFTLADIDNRMVSLSSSRQGKRGTLLIFYRGYW